MSRPQGEASAELRGSAERLSVPAPSDRREDGAGTSRSSSNWLWQDILIGKLEVYVTTDILLEYLEIITQKMGKEVAEAAIDLLSDLPNVYFIQKYYFWQLIEADPDDNKFVDCAIAAGANFLVSNDKHFSVMNNFPYFNVKVVKLKEFQSFLES